MGALFSFVIYIFLRSFLVETEPCIYIESLDVVSPIKVSYANPPSISSSSNLTGSWNVSIGYYNHLQAKISYYDYIDVSIYYRDAFIANGSTAFSTIHQGTNQLWFNIAVMIEASATNLDDMAAYSLAQDIKRGNALKFSLKVATVALVSPNWLYNGRKSRLMFYVPEDRIGPRSSEKFICNSGKKCKDWLVGEAADPECTHFLKQN